MKTVQWLIMAWKNILQTAKRAARSLFISVVLEILRQLILAQVINEDCKPVNYCAFVNDV